MLALFVAVGACAPRDDAPSSSTPGAAETKVATRCSEAVCAALSGPCQRGSCDPESGVCRSEPAREGEACLEGSGCGEGQCRSGRCVPLDPSACNGLDDACHVGVCWIEQGRCVAERREIEGTHCGAPVPIAAQGLDRALAAAECAQHSTGIAGCTPPAGGPSVHFELDLRFASSPSEVTLVVDAEYPFDAVLTLGPCEDPVMVACAEPLYGDDLSRQLRLALEPGLYRLTVTATGEAPTGSVQVVSAVAPPACDVAPQNDECGTTSVALDPALRRQSVLSTFACASVGAISRCQGQPDPDVFYRLDLSGRASTLVEVDAEDGAVALLFAMSDQSCGAVLGCGVTFSARVPAGVYALGVAHDDLYTSRPASDLYAARVSLDVTDCAASANDSIETAVVLDPSLRLQHLEGNTACGTDDSPTVCDRNQRAPDLFYRLDLRGRPGPTRLKLDGRAATNLVTYVLAPARATGVPTATQCLEDGAYRELSEQLTLAPREYFLVIDGATLGAGSFALDLTLEPAGTPPFQCLSDLAYDCQESSEPACVQSRAHPDCLLTAIECGLSPDVYAAFCSNAPGCCDGSASPDECIERWDADVFNCPSR